MRDIKISGEIGNMHADLIRLPSMRAYVSRPINVIHSKHPHALTHTNFAAHVRPQKVESGSASVCSSDPFAPPQLPD